jgi:hypothetical protein
MNLVQYILPEYFFGALIVGILFCLVVTPEPTVIVKHPTPFNSDTVTFRDSQSNCYRYDPAPTTCPDDPKLIQKYEFV